MRVFVLVMVLASARVAVAQTWEGGDPDKFYPGLSIDTRKSPVVEATVDGIERPASRSDVVLKTKGRSTVAYGLHGKPDQELWRATFDLAELDVFDGEKHWIWVEAETPNGRHTFTNGVTLRFSPAGVEIPLDFDLHDVPQTPSWVIALFGLAQLLMLVLAYRVALRESPPQGPRSDPSR